VGSAARGAGQDAAAAAALEVRDLQRQLAALDVYSRQRDARWDQRLEGIERRLQAAVEELAALRQQSVSAAGSFLAGPPPSSDSVGVAKVAVFAPRVDVESLRRRDTVTLKVRRLDSVSVRGIGELELTSDLTGIDLPLDQNGGLYVVDWVTGDGQAFSLVLRDGATNQPAATVQVKPQQSQGRFIFVGYRLE
jgi:hypothetical protein